MLLSATLTRYKGFRKMGFREIDTYVSKWQTTLLKQEITKIIIFSIIGGLTLI